MYDSLIRYVFSFDMNVRSFIRLFVCCVLPSISYREIFILNWYLCIEKSCKMIISFESINFDKIQVLKIEARVHSLVIVPREISGWLLNVINGSLQIV